jgi:hypothetical protein
MRLTGGSLLAYVWIVVACYTGALCCSMLSLAGFLFLFVVGVLVQVQPEYMKLGKNVRSSTPLFETGRLRCKLYGEFVEEINQTIWLIARSNCLSLCV